MKLTSHPILIASHPRSGTHLTIDVLRKHFQDCSAWKYPGEPLDRLYLALEGLTATQKAISRPTAEAILRRSPRPLLKTHTDPTLAHLKPQYSDLRDWIHHNAQTIYVVRDGRSVLCSLHLFMQSFAPETRCSLSDFLRQDVNGQSRIKIWVEHVRGWMKKPDVHVLKFEDLIRTSKDTIFHLGQALDMAPRDVQPLLPRSPKTIWQGRWARMTSWQPESTAIIGYYGGQKTKKWKHSFSMSDRAFFHQEAGDLLMELGYVESDAWIDADIPIAAL